MSQQTQQNGILHKSFQRSVIPYSHCKLKRSGANRTAESTPFTLAQNVQQCAFHNSILFTLHTVECGSFHTGSEAKRTIQCCYG